MFEIKEEIPKSKTDVKHYEQLYTTHKGKSDKVVIS